MTFSLNYSLCRGIVSFFNLQTTQTAQGCLVGLPWLLSQYCQQGVDWLQLRPKATSSSPSPIPQYPSRRHVYPGVLTARCESGLEFLRDHQGYIKPNT